LKDSKNLMSGYRRAELTSTAHQQFDSSGQLVFRDQSTGQIQYTEAEAEHRRLAENQWRIAKEQCRVAEEQRRLAEAGRDQERLARVAAENDTCQRAEELVRLRAQMGATAPDSASDGPD
jgi:hypothetical protein